MQATAEQERIRDIRTPEGLHLPFEVASAADRLAAFGLDFLIVHGAVVGILLAGYVAGGAAFGRYAQAFAVLASFFLRNFYFTFFELRWGGTTIGKRRLGLKVVARDGGVLRTEAVLARNLTRDIEVFLPLTALLYPQALLPDLPKWAAFLGSLWLIAFALLPLLNKDRLRVGDVVGGTLVVRMPKARLMEDLAEHYAGAFRGTGTPVSSRDYGFTREQLDLYGIKELQVLEHLLRRSEGTREFEVLEAVAERIKKKIGWPRERWDVDTWDFLSAFYRAQRRRLEHKMLFGVRQERKKDADP